MQAISLINVNVLTRVTMQTKQLGPFSGLPVDVNLWSQHLYMNCNTGYNLFKHLLNVILWMKKPCPFSWSTWEQSGHHDVCQYLQGRPGLWCIYRFWHAKRIMPWSRWLLLNLTLVSFAVGAASAGCCQKGKLDNTGEISVYSSFN